MIEVFKTNLVDEQIATEILTEIHSRFVNYKANFDLDDCDKILRVVCPDQAIDTLAIILLLRQRQVEIEVLSDEIQLFNDFNALQTL